MASAFFVIMGGVAYRRGLDFEIWDEELDFPYLMLNPTGFLELAKKKVLHPGILDNRSIVDRSKADSLAKLLVCAQAFWMVLNVITRKLDGLPNTLIELNVVVHVVVMVVVYGLWWDKPLGVATPIILNPSINSHDGEFQSFSDDAEDTRALVSLHREILSLHHCDGPMKYVSSEKIDTSWGMKYWLLGQSHYWYWLPIYKDFDLKYLESDVNHREYKDLLGYTVQIPENTDLEFKILEICTAEKIPARKEQERKVKVADLQLNSERHSEGLLLLPGQLLVWNGLGGNSRRLHFGSHCRSKSNPYFITKSYMLQLRNLYFHSYGRTPHGSSCKFATSDPTNMVVDGGISNWSENGSSNWLPAPILTIGATILSILYAGCHATAWSAHFPTFTERYFWRGACIVIASGGPFFFILHLLNVFDEECDFVQGYKDKDVEDLADEEMIPQLLSDYCIGPLYINMYMMWFVLDRAGTLLYVLARIFIVIESFISMRNLPVGAYDSIDWIQVLPHM